MTALALAVPAGALVTYGVERLRASDLKLALERVVRSQINDQVRERCESDPNWFLTGPLEGRPRKGEFDPNGDQLMPRPKLTDQPFELFAYDETFSGSSSAAPGFPRTSAARSVRRRAVSSSRTRATPAPGSRWRSRPDGCRRRACTSWGA